MSLSPIIAIDRLIPGKKAGGISSTLLGLVKDFRFVADIGTTINSVFYTEQQTVIVWQHHLERCHLVIGSLAQGELGINLADILGTWDSLYCAAMYFLTNTL